MTSWTDLKSRSRQALHVYMGRPANFYEVSTDTDFTLVSVRVHTQDKRVGDLAGTNLSYAETAERPPEVLFWNTDLDGVSLARGAVVVLSSSEGYHIESVNPPDGETTKCEVTPLRASELAGLIPPSVT